MTRQPFLKLYWEARIDGKVVKRKQLSRSFVVGWARFLLGQLSQSNASAQLDTGGTSRTVTAGLAIFDLRSAADASLNGVVIGTGTTAVAVGDTKLATQIVTGSSSGQMRYLVQQFGNLSSTSTTNDFTVIRSFQNNSGASITVNELGIYANVNSWEFCIVRDVVGGGIAVANGKVLTVTYTFSAAI